MKFLFFYFLSPCRTTIEDDTNFPACTCRIAYSSSIFSHILSRMPSYRFVWANALSVWKTARSIYLCSNGLTGRSRVQYRIIRHRHLDAPLVSAQASPLIDVPRHSCRLPAARLVGSRISTTTPSRRRSLHFRFVFFPCSSRDLARATS